MLARRSGTVLVADTPSITPDAATLADRDKVGGGGATPGHEPRVAFLSFSTFGDPRAAPGSVRDAVSCSTTAGWISNDGEMAADVALDPGLRAALYPFCRLTGGGGAREKRGRAQIVPVITGVEGEEIHG
jgi:malate dehydrogenase (oxaloacetate-decarboxylating)(NADP+)